MSRARVRPTRRGLVDFLIRTQFIYFLRKVFETLCAGEAYCDDWYIDAMCHQLEKVRLGQTRRLLITLPPRHLKSICGSVAFAAWCVAHDPSLKIIDVSYGDVLSADRSRMFREVVTSSWYRRLFPEVEITEANADVVRTSRGGFRRAASLKGPVTGLGADLIIVDDIIKAQDVFSQAEREGTEARFRQALLSRLNDRRTGRVIVLGQRLHEDDLPGHLIRTGLYTHLNLPAIAIEDEVIEIAPGRRHKRKSGDVLSARQPMAVLDEMRAEHGDAVFKAQYQQTPGASEAGLLEWAQIKTYEARVPREQMEQVCISWDTGNTPSPKSDYSVGTVWGFRAGAWHLLDIGRGQWDFPTLASRVRAAIVQWRPSRVIIEDCGSGTSLLQTLLIEQRAGADWAKTGCQVRRHSPRIDKATRFTAVIEKLTSDRFLFPSTAPWLAALRSEMLSFPDYCRNDDQVDSIVQFIEWVSFNPDGRQQERGRQRPQGRPRPPIRQRSEPLLNF